MNWKGFAALTVIFVLAPLAAQANPITPQERKDCKRDYQAYCKQYPLGSQPLHDCMHRVAKQLSHACVEALYYAGEMTRSQAEALIRRK